MAEPELSFILATDTYATIRPVIESLRRQTMRDRIELVLVAPPGAVEEAQAFREEFASLRIVEDSVDDLAPARAAGVRAASAEWVFIGETHAYPHPEMAERLMRHISGPWSIVVPEIGNANPVSVWSWAGHLSDYGQWAEGRSGGELPTPPVYDAVYRRDALLALGDRLATALIPVLNVLPMAMRDAGHKAFFEPDARLGHLNVASPKDWLVQRFMLGAMTARYRARRWSPARRALYAAATPLIAVVLCRRALPGTWRTMRMRNLPFTTLLWVAASMAIKASGELVGYVGAAGAPWWERKLYEYEVHKLTYAGIPEPFAAVAVPA